MYLKFRRASPVDYVVQGQSFPFVRICFARNPGFESAPICNGNLRVCSTFPLCSSAAATDRLALEPRAAVRRQRAAPHSAIGVNAQPSHEELCSCLTGTCSPRRHTLARSPAAPPQSAPSPSPNSPASVRSGCRRRRGFPGRASHCGPTGAGGLRRLLTALIKFTHSQRPRDQETKRVGRDQETHRKNCGGMRES